MKSTINIIAIAVLGMLLSCNSGSQHAELDEHEEHGEHEQEGVVMLTEQQQEALNLQLGTFQMRNLTTVVKINGQLEVSPSASAAEI